MPAISQLPAATLPLNGTELIPLVQAGVTVEASLKSVFQRNAIAFNAGNFSGKSGMTWTVVSAGQLAYSYTLLGSWILLNFGITGTVGGTLGPILRIAVPGQFAVAEESTNSVYIENAGAYSTGYAKAAVVVDQVAIVKDPTGDNFAAGTTYVYGQLMIAVS